MMALYDSDMNLLSIGFRNMSPLLIDARLIENRLLDGSLHIQTVDEGHKLRRFDLLANEEQVDIINTKYAQGAQLRLEVDDKYYIGFIRKPEWSRETKREALKVDRWYMAKIEFMIVSEGSI
jgi:hypothetical protein